MTIFHGTIKPNGTEQSTNSSYFAEHHEHVVKAVAVLRPDVTRSLPRMLSKKSVFAC